MTLTTDIIDVTMPLIVLCAGGIGWLIKLFLSDRKEKRKIAEEHQKKDNELIHSVNNLGDQFLRLEDIVLAISTRTLKLEFLSLINNHPDEEVAITNDYDKLKSLGQNSYVDSEFKKWQKELVSK